MPNKTIKKFASIGGARFGVLLLVAGSLLAWWMVTKADHRMRENLMQQTKLMAEGISATGGDGVAFLTGTRDNVKNAAYLRLKEQLGQLRKSNSSYHFIYLMGGVNGLIGSQKAISAGENGAEKLTFLADDRPVGDKDEAPAGMVYDDAPKAFLEVAKTGVPKVDGPYSDRWGSFVSGCTPLSTSKPAKQLRYWQWILMHQNGSGILLKQVCQPLLSL